MVARRVRTGVAAAVGLVALLGVSCGSSGSGPSVSISPSSPTSSVPPASPTPASRNPAAIVAPGRYHPTLDPADFVSAVDNPYFPLAPGSTWRYEGTTADGHEVDVVHVTSRTKQILGITATVVHDQVFTDGSLTEDTFDWYAQDRWGNVWYLGEDTEELDGSKVTSTEGSWEAGVDGAQPGILMLGDPRVSDAYRQELLPGEAEDLGRVIGLDGSITVPAGSFDAVITTEDRTPLEPTIREHKFYAPGVGVVLERLVQGGSEVSRLVEFTPGP